MINLTFDEVFTIENLYKAHLKGRISKRAKRPIVRYELSLLERIYELYKTINAGTYRITSYNSFTIFEPKQREIQTLHYSDRVVQHVICDQVIAPYFTKHAICDNCVCQVGKGTHFALRRLENSLRHFIQKNGNKGYVLKCDIYKYFPTIPHQQLQDMVSAHFRDKRLREFVMMIIDSYHTNPTYLEKCGIEPVTEILPHKFVRKMYTTGRGIPIGNQTSQIFGMFYLDPVDRLVKEKLRVKIYSRYMDDFVLIHEDKQFLYKALEQINVLVDKLGLKLNAKTQIFPLKNGLTYLGFRYQITPSGKLIKKVAKKTVKRFYARARLLNRAYADGAIGDERVRCALAAYHGHFQHAHCFRLEQKLIKRIKVAEIAQQKKLKEMNLQ